MPEIVYVLTNGSMPKMVKIGRTTNSIEQRVKQLDTTGVPLPFRCFYAAEVTDSMFVEKNVHLAFSAARVRGNREFFWLEPHHAAAAIKLAAIKDVTPKADVVNDASDIGAMQLAIETQERKTRLRFSKIGIPSGAVLQLAKDPSVTCVVVDDGKVNFDSTITSPSAAALSALKKLGFTWAAVSGSQQWLYEDETLAERRERLLSESTGEEDGE